MAQPMAKSQLGNFAGPAKTSKIMELFIVNDQVCRAVQTKQPNMGNLPLQV